MQEIYYAIVNTIDLKTLTKIIYIFYIYIGQPQAKKINGITLTAVSFLVGNQKVFEMNQSDQEYY